MKRRHYSIKLTIFSLVFFLSAVAFFAQKPGSPAPRTEKLLNGLKLLMWNDPKSDKVTLKVRVHAGSSFDPQQKEGVMQLLADSIFPNEAAKEFFTEELGGSLTVECNYDYLQVSATGNADRMLEILETVANAVENPTIDKETTTRLKNSLLERVAALEKDPAYLADRAAAKRLFGTYPYGRPSMGTSESIKKIEHPDLLDAKQRFLTADNATVTLTGRYNADLAFRAMRRYLGAWLKSDKRVPATFRQPETPQTAELKIDLPDLQKRYTRWASNAPGRASIDYYAARIAIRAWQKQLCLNDESNRGASRYDVYLLRGIYSVARSEVLPPPGAEPDPSKLPVYSGPCSLFLHQKDGTVMYPVITQQDFDEQKTRLRSEFSQDNQPGSKLTDLWLDIATYNLGSVLEEEKRLDAVTLQDVIKAAEKLQKEPLVTVVLTRAEPKPAAE